MWSGRGSKDNYMLVQIWEDVKLGLTMSFTVLYKRWKQWSGRKSKDKYVLIGVYRKITSNEYRVKYW